MSNPTGNDTFKELSIQVSLDGFSFYARGKSVLERKFTFDKPLNPEQCLEKIEKKLLEEKLLDASFENVRVAYNNELYTLVPKSLFETEKSADYLKYNTKILSTDYIAHDHIDDLDLVCVYIPFTNINNYLFECFGTFEYNHSITLTLSELFDNFGKGDATTVHAFLRARHFDLIVRTGKTLRLCNTFEHSVSEDIAYHTLFCYEQLGLDPNRDILHLYGPINEDSDIYRLLYTYIRGIHLNKEEVFTPINA